VIPLRDANPTRRTPVVTLGLIIACTVAFAWEVGLLVSGGEAALTAFVDEHGVVPVALAAAFARFDLLAEPATDLVKSLFLHGSWIHLGGNMLYLWIFGNNIEDRLGRLGFLLFYLAGGAIAGLTHAAIAPRSDVPLVGASGAIAAALGAYLVLYPRARIQSLVFLGFFYQLIAVPAVIVLGFWFVLQLIDGFTTLGAGTADDAGIAFFAHIGGFVFGMVAGLVIRWLSGRVPVVDAPPPAGPRPEPGGVG
jgi:membrane associated rhomboid family serine protease